MLDNSFLAGNYQVSFTNTAVTILSLRISPIPANTIRLIMPSSNTLTSNAFVTIGTGYTVIIDNGGVFENSAGVTSGTNFTITDTFRINNGGRYIHRTRSGHAGWNSRLSRIPGTEYGVFEFDVNGGSYPVATSNDRIYGTIELSSLKSGGLQTYTSNAGGTFTVNGDIIINSGVTYSYTPPVSGIFFIVNRNLSISSSAVFDLCASGSYSMSFQVKGNSVIDGILRESGNTADFELKGSSNQSISGVGSIQNSVSLIINNPSGATLNSPLTLPYSLTLTNGKLSTSSTNLLTIADNATCTGASSVSFVDGPMRKIGDEAFTFPIGKGGMYAPIGISGGTGTATDEFTAEYIRSNPQTDYGINYAAGINHVSFVEYWHLDRGASTTSGRNVSIAVHQQSFCMEPANTFISRWNGIQWTNETSAASGFGPCGIYQCGTVTTGAEITGFSPFTLATDRPVTNNPLPIKLTRFDAVKLSASRAQVSWELAACCSKGAKFELEKSTDGSNYALLTTLASNDTGRHYSYADNRLAAGVTHYRLKVTEADGRVTYSKAATVTNTEGNYGLSVSLFPNPVREQALLLLSATKKETVQLTIISSSGAVVKQWQQVVAAGTQTASIDMRRMPAGIYQLVCRGETQRAVLRFVKQ